MELTITTPRVALEFVSPEKRDKAIRAFWKEPALANCPRWYSGDLTIIVPIHFLKLLGSYGLDFTPRLVWPYHGREDLVDLKCP